MNDRTPGAKAKILLMDDDDIVLDITSQMMESFGYQVDLAKDGDEALQRYSEAAAEAVPYDAVILDLTVRGGTGGIDAMQRLQKLDPEAKVVISSGYSSDPVMENFRDYGFCEAVTKPFRLDRLKVLLEEILRH